MIENIVFSLQTTTLTVEPLTTHHYQNVQELESAAADRPPAPDVSDEPVRVLNDGWVEYSLGGRPYFFHQQTGHSQWKPPPIHIEAQLAIAEWAQDRIVQRNAQRVTRARGEKPIPLTQVVSRGWSRFRPSSAAASF